MKRAVAVQLGLCGHAELAYLTEACRDNYLVELRENVHVPSTAGNEGHLPSFFAVPDDVLDAENWHYFGVDMVKEFVENLRNKYSWNPNVHLIHSKIVGNEPHEEGVRNLLLSELFQQITNLLSAPIEILFMDVEGSELEICKAFDFSVRPTFVHIECHTLGIAVQLLSLFLKHDYILMDQTATYPGSGCDIRLRFLRRDRVNKEALYFLRSDYLIKCHDPFFNVKIPFEPENRDK